MYRAKSHPDVGYAFFDAQLDSAAVQRSQRIAELREAIGRGEFRLDYQPVVDLERKRISGLRGARALAAPHRRRSCRPASSSRWPRRPA